MMGSGAFKLNRDYFHLKEKGEFAKLLRNVLLFKKSQIVLLPV